MYFDLTKMEYQTKTNWMKDLNTCDGLDEHITYISPYSDDSSANSLQGKNLTLGNLPMAYEPRNLDPVVASNNVGGCKLDRWSLMYGNPNCIPGYNPCYKYDYSGPGPIVSQQSGAAQAVVNNASAGQSSEKKENYNIPGFRGSDIICETYNGCGRPRDSSNCCCIIICVIIVLIIFAIIFGICFSSRKPNFAPVTTTGGKFTFRK